MGIRREAVHLQVDQVWGIQEQVEFQLRDGVASKGSEMVNFHFISDDNTQHRQKLEERNVGEIHGHAARGT